MSEVPNLPGDVLLYNGKDWLGQGIEWAEWIDGHEDSHFCHAALFYGPRDGMAGQWIVRQNPGGPAFEPAAVQPWANITTMRLQAEGVVVGPSYLWVGHFKAAVSRHMQDGYAYAEINDFLDQDLLARLGQGQVTHELRQKAAWFFDAHKNCCSEFDRIILNEATTAWLGWPGPVQYEVLRQLGPGQARPADLWNAPDLFLLAPAA